MSNPINTDSAIDDLAQSAVKVAKQLIAESEPNKKRYDKASRKRFSRLFKDEDAWIGNLFKPYHLQHATLRVLCETCNLTRKKYKNNERNTNKKIDNIMNID